MVLVLGWLLISVCLGWWQKIVVQLCVLLILLVLSLIIVFNWGLYIWVVNVGYVIEISLGYFINLLVNVLLGVLVLKEWLCWLQWVVVVMVVVGVVWLIIDVGMLLWIVLGLVCLFGLYGLLCKLVLVDLVVGFGVESMYLFLLVLVFVIWVENGYGGVFFYGWGWCNDLLLIFGGVVIVVLLIGFVYGVKCILLLLVGILQYIVLSLQLLLGVFFFYEVFDIVKVIGFVVIWVGLILFVGDNICMMCVKQQCRWGYGVGFFCNVEGFDFVFV